MWNEQEPDPSPWVSTIYLENVSHSERQLCDIYANVYILVKDLFF